MAAIEAEGLVKVYRTRKHEVRALDGVDLEVEEGTVLGLLGPNGAGKTTTVRILATLLRPDEGRATVGGLDVVRQAQAVRRLIGLSGQYAAVDENLTGRETSGCSDASTSSRATSPAAARTSSSFSLRSTTRATESRRRTQAACVGASTLPPRSSVVPASSFSTSRRPVSIHAAGSRCGT